MRKAFLLYFILLFLAMYITLYGKQEALSKLSSVPVVGDMIPTHEDARVQITKARQQKQGIPSSVEDAHRRQDQYMSVLERIHEGTQSVKILKKTVGDSSQTQPVGGISARLLKEGRLKHEPASMFAFIENTEDLPKPIEVFLVAIIGDGLEWERKVGVVNESTIIDSPDEEATLWVKVDADVADKLYEDILNNISKKELMNEAFDYIMEGKIQISPYERFQDFAQRFLK